MRVFVAGATGAIGRPLVRKLLAAGHDVTGMTRYEDKVASLREAGAQGVVCNIFDADRLIRVVGDAKPDAVIHEVTSIPKVIDLKQSEQQFVELNRVRSEGTQNLLRAARQARVLRIVAQSVAFAYAPEEEWVKREDAALFLDAPGAFKKVVHAIAYMEQEARRAPGMEAVILRYGHFYGPGTAFAPGGQIAELVKSGQFPIAGKGSGMYSFIHVEDAAAATVAAFERWHRGTYNVVDDEPAPVREWLPLYAKALGAPRPRRVPAFVLRWRAGPYAAYLMTAQRGASNARVRHDPSWGPAYPTWRSGFPATLGGAP